LKIGRSVVIPEIAYTNVLEAAAWLCSAFGFEERLRIADHRVQLTFGEGAIVVTELDPKQQNADLAHAVLVRVEGIDQHCERAVRHGARLIRPLQSYPYGGSRRSYLDLLREHC